MLPFPASQRYPVPRGTQVPSLGGPYLRREHTARLYRRVSVHVHPDVEQRRFYGDVILDGHVVPEERAVQPHVVSCKRTKFCTSVFHIRFREKMLQPVCTQDRQRVCCKAPMNSEQMSPPGGVRIGATTTNTEWPSVAVAQVTPPVLKSSAFFAFFVKKMFFSIGREMRSMRVCTGSTVQYTKTFSQWPPSDHDQNCEQ